MVCISVNGNDTLSIVHDNRSTERKCLVLDLVKALGIALVFQSDRRNIIGRRRNICCIGGIAHKLYRLFVLTSVTLDHFIGYRYKIAEIKISQTILDHILDTIKLLCIEYLTVKFVSDLEVNKVSRYLNRQLIVCQRSKRKTYTMQIGEIRFFTVLSFTEIVDKPLCLVKRSFKCTLKVHDLHRLVRIMLNHSCAQECRKCCQLTVRLDLHFVATVIDTADGIAAIKQFTDLFAVSDSQFPCATLRFRRFAVCSEELVNDLL